MLFKKKVKIDYSQMGFNDLEEKASKGDASAQYELGFRFSFGNGVKKDEKQAIIWLQKAADKGEPSALYFLAIMLYSHKDINKAVSYLMQSASNGNIDACLTLGRWYYSGYGSLKSDYKKAFDWFTRATKQKTDNAFALGEAYHELSRCYLLGKGTNVDNKKGVAFEKRAAELGSAVAKVQLDSLKKSEEEAEKYAKEYMQREFLENRQKQTKKVSTCSSTQPIGPNPERIFYFEKAEMSSSQDKLHKDFFGLPSFELSYDVTFIYRNNKGVVWKISHGGRISDTEPGYSYSEYDLKNGSLKKYMRNFLCKNDYVKNGPHSGEYGIEKWL